MEAKMIILQEYHLVMVDHIGFIDFCVNLQPLVKVLYRNTIKTDIMKMFKEKKESTIKLLPKNQSRITITIDIWTTTNQNKSYIMVTLILLMIHGSYKIDL